MFRLVKSVNNRAERAIKPIMVYGKISSGSISEKGAKEFTRVYGVLEPCIKTGKLPFRSHPGWLQTAELLLEQH